MIKKEATKSLKLQKGLSRKPARKRCQPDAQKKVARKGKGSTPRAKVRKPIQQFAVEQTKSAVNLRHRTGKSSSAVVAKPVSPQLRELEKGRRWKQLLDQGYSFAKLAVKFECSKSLVSNLVQLASLPDDLKQDYLEGKVGRKKVLEMARARKKKVEKKAAVIIEDSRNHQLQKPSPEPGAFVTPNPQQNPPPKAQAVVTSSNLQCPQIRISTPAMTEEDRQKKVFEYAKLIIDCFHGGEYPNKSRDDASLNLAPCDWEGFFQQVKFGLYGPFCQFFRQEAPQPHEINPDEDPWEVIKRCKVEGGDPNFVPDIINNAVTWFFRWVQRVIPDRTVIEDAIDQARSQLLREARNAR